MTRSKVKIPMDGKTWNFSARDDNLIKEKMDELKLCSLVDIFDICVGVKTTADTVFVQPMTSSFVYEREFEDSVIYPLIQSFNVNKWNISWGESSKDRYILYPHSEIEGKMVAIPLEEIPKAAEYFEECSEVLKKRSYLIKSKNRKWYECWVPQKLSKFQQTKIITRDIVSRNSFALDESGRICQGNTFFLTRKPSVFMSEYLGLNEHQYYCFMLGVLNSKAMEYYQKMISGCLYSQKYRYTTSNLNRWPIPEIRRRDAVTIAGYVDDLIVGMEGGLEREIDKIIYDAFDLTQQLVEVECPICHSPMKVNEMEKSDDYYEALATEKIKIEVQLAELDETIKDLSDEIISKKQRISKLENYKEEITDNLNNNLGPIVAEKVKKVQELMDAQERINLITRNEKRINKYNTEISKWQEKIDSTGQEKGKKIEDLPEAYTNELCKEIKFLLQGCDFIGKEGKIKYNNATEDVEVGEKEKASYGKGARAIINSTFLIGIMNYCYKRNLCHPGIVVLDSPLTTYKEKDKKDGDDETITKGTKEKFYEMLAEQKNGQIIIFDNEEPSSTVKTKINYLHFSGDSTVGRKGLIP